MNVWVLCQPRSYLVRFLMSLMSGQFTGSALGALSTTSLLAPAQPTTSSLSTFTSILWITETVTSHVFAFDTSSEIPLANSSVILSSALSTQVLSSNFSTTPLPLQSWTTTTTATEIVTETTTDTVTLPVTTLATPSPSPSPSPSPGSSRTIWSAPAQMSDLSAFNVSSFTSGEHNLNIVTGIPASASATFLSIAASEPTSAANSNPPTGWDNSSTVLQLLYPAQSINPGNRDRPQGGAQFYATPLPEIVHARNVTLTYSIFFPEDFDWVLAGKLPGLYGGREGCSGGDEALDCFSTRLMWRKGGFGELYLYAPKDEQPDSLCNDPQSVCDAVYGFSIGRGSFKWVKGGWTTVQQCVTLNTPGMDDGSFTLDVNGQRAIDRSDIFYRSAPPPPLNSEPQEFFVTRSSQGTGAPAGKKKGGLLGPILRGLLPRVRFGYRRDIVVAPQARQESVFDFTPTNAEPNASEQSTFNPVPFAQQAVEGAPDKPIGFIGLFFSTFFGGHEPRYATPRDQYVWFKDFAITYNG